MHLSLFKYRPTGQVIRYCEIWINSTEPYLVWNLNGEKSEWKSFTMKRFILLGVTWWGKITSFLAQLPIGRIQFAVFASLEQARVIDHNRSYDENLLPLPQHNVVYLLLIVLCSVPHDVKHNTDRQKNRAHMIWCTLNLLWNTTIQIWHTETQYIRILSLHRNTLLKVAHTV